MPKKIIYAEDAIEALTEIESHFVFEDGHDHLLRWAKNTITALPSAQPEQRWIPVDEGRPKDETVCLVTDSKGLVEIATFAEDLYEFDEYDFHDKRGVAGWINFDDEWGRYFDVDNVVAWMPLPKPMELEED